jgi:hypothetical protein
MDYQLLVGNYTHSLRGALTKRLTCVLFTFFVVLSTSVYLSYGLFARGLKLHTENEMHEIENSGFMGQMEARALSMEFAFQTFINDI